MEKKNELPVEVVEEIHANANAYINSYPGDGTEWGAYINGATTYATKLHEAEENIKELRGDIDLLKWDVAQYDKEKKELERQNEKMKAMSIGWRPLLEAVLREHECGRLPNPVTYEKIKTFLYGE